MRDIHIIRVKNQFLEIDLQTRPHNFLESNFYKSLLETIFYKKNSIGLNRASVTTLSLPVEMPSQMNCQTHK
jgi:hypothetical protein